MEKEIVLREADTRMTRVKVCDSGTVFFVQEGGDNIIAISKHDIPVVVEFLSRFL